MRVANSGHNGRPHQALAPAPIQNKTGRSGSFTAATQLLIASKFSGVGTNIGGAYRCLGQSSTDSGTLFQGIRGFKPARSLGKGAEPLLPGPHRDLAFRPGLVELPPPAGNRLRDEN